ncbi:MAG: UvrD-helicase domain-containing protein [Sulfurovaceae bacterium]|nr:UvrD-helicase domain-containing protein [Sulfurovaceae bacterium]
MDLKTLEHNHETKISEISDLEINLDRFTSEIKGLKNIIATSYKTFLEKLFEIISFGFIKYDKKYDEIINKHTKTIFKLKATSKSIKEKLATSKKEASQLQELFESKLHLFKKSLIQFQDKLLDLAVNSYINDYTREKLQVKLGKIITGNEKYLTYENISLSIKELIGFIQDSCEWVRYKNTIFVKNEKIKEKSFFDSIESNPLTEKQKDAVLVNENNNLILAGAGSGKTSVIVAKVAYLINKNILHPNEILVLAFNKNAQEELSDRFKEKHLFVKIKTFHSFGLSVIAEAMSQKPDLCPMTESSGNMTRFIKNTIHKLMASMSVFLENFVNFVAYFSIPYKSESEFNSLGEYYDYQKSYDMKTLKHEVEIKGKYQGQENLTTLKEETVKSHQELVIANFLTLNGISYLYEEPYKHKTYTVEKRQYKPDFYLPDYDIYIEHFGIDRNNNTAPYIDKDEYLEGIKWKIATHEEYETNLVQTFSYEFTENKLLILLKEKLLKNNVIFRELEYAEVSELLKQSDEDSKFTKLFTSFLTHYKSNMHSLDDIKKKSIEIERTTIFLKLFEYIFNEYKEFQERNNCIDFDDMIVKALNAIEKNKYKHGFKHIFIDEFQDISTTRATLIKELLSYRDVSLTAVGDDWQSINRFAGSNIKIIQEFKEIYGKSETITLDYTFRFDDNISKIASDFVQKNPNQIKKSISTIKIQKQNKFSILLFWNTGDSKSDLEKIINLIAKKEKDNTNIKILILARYNFLLTSELRSLKTKYEYLNIRFSTVHGSKGNEADYVIVLNIDKGKFGFPSKIEDDPILNIVIPEGDTFEDAEERRLFYVAITRTKSTVFLLSDRYNKSSFIDEVIKNYKDDIYFINDPKIKLLNCSECKTGILRKRTKSKDKNKHFYGCSNFPRCKYTENVHYCPECNEEMIKDEKKKIAKCLSENCDFETMLCIECNGYMIERQGRHGAFLGCASYPKCEHTSNIFDKNTINFDNLF